MVLKRKKSRDPFCLGVPGGPGDRTIVDNDSLLGVGSNDGRVGGVRLRAGVFARAEGDSDELDRGCAAFTMVDGSG